MTLSAYVIDSPSRPSVGNGLWPVHLNSSYRTCRFTIPVLGLFGWFNKIFLFSVAAAELFIVVFRSREVANVRMTQQYRIDICLIDTTKDSRNSNK
jgi:hypothetical protein